MDTVDDALLVVEELVANVLDHARTRFQLIVRLTGSVLHLAVHDGSTGAPEVRPFDPHAGRGRGLQLVSTLAARWGCDTDHGGQDGVGRAAGLTGPWTLPACSTAPPGCPPRRR